MVDKIKHVVVVMFENRSLDNLFGYLYEDKPEKKFNGVYGKDLSNPIPQDHLEDGKPTVVKVSKGNAFNSPSADPGEEYGHVNLCLWNKLNPPENAKLHGEKMVAPYNLPDLVDGELPVPTMEGFVADFIYTLEERTKKRCTYDEYSQIMNCMTPQAVPIISSLARGFAICDNYFCDAPTQTCPNRSFFFAASSAGNVINDPADMGRWTKENANPTLFDQLEENKVSWRVYFDSHNVAPMTYLIHFPRLKKLPERVGFIDHFMKDVEKGTLPQFSFIEPRLWGWPNDFHPADELNLDQTNHSSVLGGENFLHEIYTAIRGSNNPTGSNWENTLLIVTFDEAGGTYDHVVPPSATPPSAKPGEMDFNFDRLGIRIPCIFISPWVSPETVISDQLQHTSLLGFFRELFHIKSGPLNARDASAPRLPIEKIFSLTKPRDRLDTPMTVPHDLPGKKKTMSEAMNGLHLTVLNGLIAVVGENADSPHHGIVKVFNTVTAANKWMKETVEGLNMFSSMKPRPAASRKMILLISFCFFLALLALTIYFSISDL